MKTKLRSEKKRILVVDDRANNTKLLKLFLERTNDYLVQEENDSNEAIATAELFEPHLILLDVMMPGLDGGELAACFQANPKTKSVPIVFLTAAITKAEVDKAGGVIGNFPFLAKPVVLSEVVACLKKQLGE